MSSNSTVPVDPADEKAIKDGKSALILTQNLSIQGRGGVPSWAYPESKSSFLLRGEGQEQGSDRHFFLDTPLPGALSSEDSLPAIPRHKLTAPCVHGATYVEAS